MLYRSRVLVALLALAALAACNDDDDEEIVGPRENQAFVRVANATDAAIDVRNSGVLTNTTQNIGFGASTTCMTVNTTGATGTGLQITPTGSTTSLGFVQNFQSRGQYTVIAYPGTTAGTTLFLTLDNLGFTAGTGQSGIRLVNAAPGSGGLVLRQNGTTIGTGTPVSYGNAGPFAAVTSSTNATFTVVSGTNTVATTSALNLQPGNNYTLVVAAPSAGTTALRTFLVAGC